MHKFITTSKTQTRKLGEALAKELHKACPPKRRVKMICLSGNLGTGKTTFAQGFLKGLKIKGPYTSPTFIIMKKYNNTYHIDAYRIKDKDLLELGWKEIIADNPPAGGNIIVIEWAERVRKIIPKDAIWIKFKWIAKNERELKIL